MAYLPLEYDIYLILISHIDDDDLADTIAHEIAKFLDEKEGKE